MRPGGPFGHARHHRADNPRGGGRRLAVGVVLGVLALGGHAVVGSAQPEQSETGVRTPSESSESESPSTGAQWEPSPPLRAFAPDSWWNARVPVDAPLNPHEDEILEYLRTAPENGGGCLVLAGAGNGWGQPIYWSAPADPEYDVRGVEYNRPPEISTLRIPRGARPADNSDGSMTIYDRAKGYVVALTDAEHDEESDSWRASGATVTYLDSNGLHAATGRSDDPRNIGTHRGNNGATMAVSWDAVRAGAIRHVLKVAVGPEAADRAVFPMVGSDGDYVGNDPAVPPQGLRLRIRPGVDLEELALDADALVIARALQDYGFYIGDSGGMTALKLEDTVSEGKGRLWTLPPDALCGLPFEPQYWDVLAEGYDPSR